MKFDKTFNELLISVRVEPAEVCAIRHHMPKHKGKDFDTLYDLWRNDLNTFECFQKTQKAKALKFRSRKIWAAFVVNPKQKETIFIGLYDANWTETRPALTTCPYGGDKLGCDEDVDIFRTQLRTELADRIGKQRVDWPKDNPIVWARYAEGLDLPLL